MKRKIIDFIIALCVAVGLFFIATSDAYASEAAANDGVYVKQMGRGYCTLASACDMIRSRMWLEGNTSYPNVTQQKMKSKAWLNGAGLYHQFTYCGVTVKYSTSKCNSGDALRNLLSEYPEGIVIYIRDIPHAVLLTRYEPDTNTFYVADPVYEGEIPLMKSWQRKAGSSQDAVIRTIDAYWYISEYNNEIVPGGLIGNITSSIDENKIESMIETNLEVVNDENLLIDLLLNEQEEEMITDIDYVKSTIQLPYVNDYNDTNFIDVESGAWYESSIKAAYEMAMMIGISDTEFHVNGNITLAQTICIAARLHNSYYENNYDFSSLENEEWFMPYVRYCLDNNIIGLNYNFKDRNNFDREAMRIEFVDILSKALPEEQLTKIKEVDLITDIPANGKDERFDMIYDLYNAGILIGDGEGFKPWKEITRAEIAAVISRMADASLRIE